MNNGCKVDITPENGFLRVRVSGPNHPKTVVQYMQAVHRACEEAGTASVLIEENLSGPRLDPVEVFQTLSNDLSGIGSGFENIAYCDVNVDSDPSRVRFMENVATNRGINVRVFDDPADAERWLRGVLGRTRQQ